MGIKGIIMASERKGRKRLRDNFQLIFDNWIQNNIFGFRKGDGSAYLTLYIIIPVIMTVVSLSSLPRDNVSIIYCYVTIFISAVNGIYDGALRWDASKKSIYNAKILLIFISNMIVAVYCMYVFLYILIQRNTGCRMDYILLIYILTITVAFFDVVSCFMRGVAWTDCLKREVDN